MLPQHNRPRGGRVSTALWIWFPASSWFAFSTAFRSLQICRNLPAGCAHAQSGFGHLEKAVRRGQRSSRPEPMAQLELVVLLVALAGRAAGECWPPPPPKWPRRHLSIRCCRCHTDLLPSSMLCNSSESHCPSNSCLRAGWPCSPGSSHDCPKPPGGLHPSQVPQFITSERWPSL